MSTLRNDTCIRLLQEHAKKKSWWHPAPCQCPWCRRARTILKEMVR